MTKDKNKVAELISIVENRWVQETEQSKQIPLQVIETMIVSLDQLRKDMPVGQAFAGLKPKIQELLYLLGMLGLSEIVKRRLVQVREHENEHPEDNGKYEGIRVSTEEKDPSAAAPSEANGEAPTTPELN